MQQVMDMVQGLQEAMAASKAEQERKHADLVASQARYEELHRANEELHRGWRNNLGQRDVNEPEQFIPPRGFSMPFSQPILERKTKRGVVMVIEHPPISDAPMEVGPLEEATSAELTLVEATPAGATPREDSRTEESQGDASPMEEISKGGSPTKKVAEEVSPGGANEATPMRKDSGDQPKDNAVERQISGRIFKLGRLLSQKEQDEVAAVIARHLDAFAWSASDMPGIDPDFLCHHLTMDAKVRPIR